MHPGRKGADQVKVGSEVHRNRLFKAAGTTRLDRAKRAKNAGIGNETIQTTKAFADHLAERLDALGVFQIHRHKNSFAAKRADLVVKLLQRGLGAGNRNDDVALTGKLQRGGAANATRASGKRKGYLSWRGSGKAIKRRPAGRVDAPCRILHVHYRPAALDSHP